MPSRQEVHLDRALSDFSIGVLQEQSNHIAGSIFPIVEVDRLSNRYYVLDRNPFARADARPRGANQESAGFDFQLSTDNYACQVYALHTDVDNKLLSNSDDPRLIEESAVRLVTDNIRLTHEVAWAEKYFKPGVWGTTRTGGTHFTPWNSYGTSDPRKDVKDAVRAITVDGGIRPNVMVIGYDVWRALQDHPIFVDRIKYVSDETISQQIMARMLELDRLVVCQAVRATNAPGTPDSYDFIHGKHALLCYASPNPGPLSPSAGYVFAWTGTNSGQTVAVRRIGKPLHDATRYEVEMNWDDKVTGAKLGYFFEGAVA